MKNKIIHVKLLNEDIANIEDLPFKDDIENAGGKIYSVGGAVRDKFLGKDSKDLDILITGLPLDDIGEIISKYGTVNNVGKSFGIIKFKEYGSDEDIDIAIPRTEQATGEGGHKGFDIKSDHTLPIEKDLERRDFTINAIAKSLDGNIIDPYSGRSDLNKQIIKIVNPQAFSDDPLRMLRAVQFASRFKFKIEISTFDLIKENAFRVNELPGERIITEFDKIVHKGDIALGAKLLYDTNLYSEIFGDDETFDSTKPFDSVTNIGEFVYLLGSHKEDLGKFFKTKLSGDNDNALLIEAIKYGFSNYKEGNYKHNRLVVVNMNKISPQSLNSNIIPDGLKNTINEIRNGDKYPLVVKDIKINGNQIMALGFNGSEIGRIQKLLLTKIMYDEVNNNYEDIVKYIEENE